MLQDNNNTMPKADEIADMKRLFLRSPVVCSWLPRKSARICYVTMIVIVCIKVLDIFLRPPSQPGHLVREIREARVVDFAHTFRPYSDSVAKIFTVHNLCIEKDPSDTHLVRADEHSGLKVPKKRLIVYGADKDYEETVVAGAHPEAASRSDGNAWKIYYTREPLPKNKVVIKTHPAYFIATSCAGHLYRFWHQQLVGLFDVLQKTNRLQSKVKNQVFYRVVQSRHPDEDCHNVARFEAFLLALRVKPEHMVYHAAPAGVCYENVVFGSPEFSAAAEKKALNYMRSAFNIKPSSCSNQKSDKRVIIIQRKSHKILNVEELKKAAIKAGFVHTQVVMFEHMPLKQRMKIVYCTDILVGVPGEGLQWATFMPPGRGLLELFWDQYPSTYVEHYKKKLFTGSLSAKEVVPDWKLFAKTYRKSKQVQKKEITVLLARGPTKKENFLQTADVKFDPDRFTEELRNIYAKMDQERTIEHMKARQEQEHRNANHMLKKENQQSEKVGRNGKEGPMGLKSIKDIKRKKRKNRFDDREVDQNAHKLAHRDVFWNRKERRMDKDQPHLEMKKHERAVRRKAMLRNASLEIHGQEHGRVHATAPLKQGNNVPKDLPVIGQGQVGGNVKNTVNSNRTLDAHERKHKAHH